MALNTQLSTAARNAAADAVGAQANGGTLRIYSGAQPATANTAASGTLLATLALSATAFGAAASGVATANAITAAAAVATATAGWFRVLKSDATTAVFDGSVGVGATFDLNMTGTADIVSGAQVSVTALTYTALAN